MFGKLLALMIVFGVGLSYARSGKEEAAKVCMRFDFQKAKQSCLSMVNSAKSFNATAVKLYNKADFQESRLACLKLIRNKKYLNTAIKICGKEDFEEGRLKCLKSSVTKSGPNIEVMKASIRGAIQYIEKGKSKQAAKALKGLLKMLEE